MKELSPEDVAIIIFEAIEQENYISKAKIVPIITATIKCFLKSNLNVVFSKKDEKIKHALEKEHANMRYWLELVRKLDPENIQEHYANQTKYMNDLGYIQNPPKLKKNGQS